MCHIYSNVCCKRHLDQASVFCCDYTALVHVVEVWFCVIQCISYFYVLAYISMCYQVLYSHLDQASVFY